MCTAPTSHQRGQDRHVRFDPWAADKVRSRRWHASQQLTELPDGQLQLRLRLNSLEEIERWILSMGAHARVVSPPELQRRIRASAEALLAKI